MGGLLLCLPVVLIILAGNIKGEAESEDGKALHIFKQHYKVEVSLDRDTRGAGKNEARMKTKKKETQSRHKQRRNRNKNKPNVAKVKKARRQRKHKRKPAKTPGRKKKPGRKYKTKRKESTRRCMKKKTKKARRRCMNKQKKDAKKQRHRHKNKKPNLVVEDIEGRQEAGGDWSSCGTDQVNDTCILNAVAALEFEIKQIMNFAKQKKRMQSHNTTIGNKMGKKGEFEEVASHMLTALGGNITNPTCGETGSTNTRSLTDSVSTYNTLINCSASIKEACTMEEKMMNMTFMEECEKIYNLSKTASEDCRTNENYYANGPLACNCWEKAAIGIVKAQVFGCTKYTTTQQKEVKQQKNRCSDALKACKNAEDEAIALLMTCSPGNVNSTG